MTLMLLTESLAPFVRTIGRIASTKQHPLDVQSRNVKYQLIRLQDAAVPVAARK
jgi:hypothetical protein